MTDVVDHLGEHLTVLVKDLDALMEDDALIAPVLMRGQEDQPLTFTAVLHPTSVPNTVTLIDELVPKIQELFNRGVIRPIERSL